MTIVKILAAIIIAIAAYFYLGQRQMLFPAPYVTLPNPLPAEVEKISLDEGYALLLPSTTNTDEASPLFIFAHGNGEAAFWHIDTMSTLRNAGFSILLLEYPGYAGAPGRPSLQSIQRSALEAYDLTTARTDIDGTNVVAYGRSIGGGAAALIAAERPIVALGLESTFSTLSRLAAEKRLPFFLLRDRFDNEKVIQELQVPLFLYHGTNDQLIPIHHSERLSKLAKTSEFVRASCGHNDCPAAWQALLTFLSGQHLL